MKTIPFYILLFECFFHFIIFILSYSIFFLYQECTKKSIIGYDVKSTCTSEVIAKSMDQIFFCHFFCYSSLSVSLPFFFFSLSLLINNVTPERSRTFWIHVQWLSRLEYHLKQEVFIPKSHCIKVRTLGSWFLYQNSDT